MKEQFAIQTAAAFIGDKTYPPRFVNVVLGNPRSEECAGLGICRFDEDWPLPSQIPPPPAPKPTKPKPPKSLISCQSISYRGVAKIERLENEDGKVSLAFSFLKNSLTPEAVKKHFGTTHFRVGSDLLLPPNLTKAFSLDPSVFSAGLYQITETRACFIIQLRIN